MNLKEWGEQNGMTLAEAKEATAIAYWNQKIEVVDGVVVPAKPKEEIIVEDDPVVEIESKQDEPSKEAIELANRCLGNKSPYWNLR